MYKCYIDMGKINKYMRIKFNIIVEDDIGTNKFANKTKCIDKFSYAGSKYLKLSPRPYITIDICESKDKNDSWNSNLQVNLNKFVLFDLLRKLRSMINKFKIKDMFFIKNNHLHVNTESANSNCEFVKTPNKIIKLLHCVVKDEDNIELEYEGICFMINSIDNYCFLTYTELEYLYYELSKINMTELSMQLLNAYLITEKHKIRNRELEIDKSISEIKDEEPNTTLPKLKKANEIPEI